MAANPTKDNLKNAFHCHKKISKMAFTISHKLLLFYAMECGLKCYYLKVNNLADAEIGNLRQSYGHDIKKLLRDCKIPNFNVNPPLEAGYPIKDFHEYMRYGVTIGNHVEISQIAFFQSIINELENYI